MFIREELKEQLEKKKKGSRALADFEDKMNEVRLYYIQSIWTGMNWAVNQHIFPLELAYF